MNSNSKRWQLFPPISDDSAKQLNKFPPVLRQILFNRGYHTQKEALQFLRADVSTEDQAADPLGVQAAVERIQDALRENEPIAIYGDYDVDGVTATALMVQLLSTLGADVRPYIPNRFHEGYGLNRAALRNLRSEGIKLVIAVDCGIRSIKEANLANELGMGMVIVDHHHPGDDIPQVSAVINPRLPSDPYPEKNLAGVGLAYKLACAILRNYPNANIQSEDLLDLVALGTVADLAPLTGENRALVRAGLGHMRRPKRQGLLALMGVAGLTPAKVRATDIGYALGPRLNAAGRLDSALAAFHLLITQNVRQAGLLAQQLDNQNRKRQNLTQAIQIAAEQQAFMRDPDPLLLFAADPEFNLGVLGLAASRLVDQFYRPAIVAHHGEKYTRASCRSIPEFHITQALDQCADLLTHYGGHAAAAGFTVQNENLNAFLSRLYDLAKEQLSTVELKPTIKIDVEIPLSELRPDLIDHLDVLEPTGYGNPKVTFLTRDLKVRRSRTVGQDGKHLKLSVSDGWITFDAIAFRQGDWNEKMPSHVDLVYNFEVNEFRDQRSLQLNVRDLKPAA